LIQAEYGWSDETILDLPFARFLQIKDRILERQNEEIRFQIMLEEVKLQISCTFVAATGSDVKANRANIENARRIRLLKEKVEDIAKEKRKNLKPGGLEEAMGFFGKFQGR